MVDRVKNTGEIDGYTYSSVNRFFPIETGVDMIQDTLEGCTSGAAFSEGKLMVS